MGELMRSATTIIGGFLLAAVAPVLSAQVNPMATKQLVQNAVGGGKPAAQAAQPTAKPAAKGGSKAATTKPKPPAPTRAGGDSSKPAEGVDTTKVARRDPFE